MQFSESWLRSFCDPAICSQGLANVLTMAGLEVEEMHPAAPSFTGVVVGEILEAVQHPNADKLRVCKVNVGQTEPLQIVCGAPNARVGIKVPCALIGAELPSINGKPFSIQVGKLRGIESFGMLCSAKELGIHAESSGLYELSLDTVAGQNIRQALNLDDVIFTLKLTPNLAHCLSIYGIARELSAITGAALKPEPISVIVPNSDDKLSVSIVAPDLCGRFTGRVVKNLNTKAATPAWMLERLERCGQRTVNVLVDISNYVMFELGQPSHIFDLTKIHDGLNVRWGKANETLKLLNGSEITVDETVGVIADENGLKSLAGVMGGDATAVSDTTEHVYIEAAFWWPDAVVGRSRRYNFSTDAGHRFERGVDPAQVAKHLDRITQLVVDICGTKETQIGIATDTAPNWPTANAVKLRLDRASKIIGMPVTLDDCKKNLERLGMMLAIQNENEILVTPPSWRFDIRIEEELIEEIIRLIGFSSLPHTPPLAPILPKPLQEEKRSVFAVMKKIAALGYQETINFSFVEEAWERDLASNTDPIRLLNPISSQMSVMRSSLMGSLLSVLKFNQLRKTSSRIRLFEVGTVFEKDTSIQDSDQTVAGFAQSMRLAGLAFGNAFPLQWGESNRLVDFFDVKGDVESIFSPIQLSLEASTHPALHPGRCANILCDEQVIGVMGELHPKWRQIYEVIGAPILFELELDALLKRVVPQFKAISKFQPVVRDMAIVVPAKTSASAVLHLIRELDLGGLLQEIQLFDIYQPKLENKHNNAPLSKSLGLRLTFSSQEATLTDEQIEHALQVVWKNLKSVLQASERA